MEAKRHRQPAVRPHPFSPSSMSRIAAGHKAAQTEATIAQNAPMSPTPLPSEVRCDPDQIMFPVGQKQSDGCNACLACGKTAYPGLGPSPLLLANCQMDGPQLGCNHGKQDNTQGLPRRPGLLPSAPSALFKSRYSEPLGVRHLALMVMVHPHRPVWWW